LQFYVHCFLLRQLEILGGVDEIRMGTLAFFGAYRGADYALRLAGPMTLLPEMGVFASLANNETQASVSGLKDFCPKCGEKL